MQAVNINQKALSEGLSFSIELFEELYNEPAFRFSKHNEYELTAICKCSGKRIVGNSVLNFKGGDLFLVGPNLTHSILAERPHECSAICIRFNENSFGKGFFETPQSQSIKSLLKKAQLGCYFYGDETIQIKEKLRGLLETTAFEKMLILLEVLNMLAKNENCEQLSSRNYDMVYQSKETKRMNYIFEYILENYKNKLTVHELANLINVSPSTFNRLFFKTTKKNFSNFLTEIRMGNACKLLLETDKTISEIAFQSGFQNISNFNRLFKKELKKSPKDYRNLV